MTDDLRAFAHEWRDGSYLSIEARPEEVAQRAELTNWREAATRVSDTLADWAATGHGPHIDVMDAEGMAFLAAIKALRAALAGAPDDELSS